MLQTSLLLMKSLNKTEAHFLIRSVFFVSKGNIFIINFSLHLMMKHLDILMSVKNSMGSHELVGDIKNRIHFPYTHG